MSGPPWVVSVSDSTRTLPEHHNAYPVIDGAGPLAGLITLNDLKRAPGIDWGGARLSEVISKNLELAILIKRWTPQ
jgi:hypothetical protein